VIQSDTARGFVLSEGSGGPFMSVDVPNPAGATSMNDSDVIVGLYANPKAASGLSK
jgi:hypothetical protein